MVTLSVLSTALLSLQGVATTFLTGQIRAEERVIFFPTIASEFNSTHWNVPIHGWIFEPEEDSKKRSAFLYLLKNVVSEVLEENFMNDYANDIFNRRARPFVVDNKRMKRVKVNLGGCLYNMPFSGKNGHFEGNITLSKHQLTFIKRSDKAEKRHETVSFQARGLDEKRVFEGVAHLVPSSGISVISDIDDTIKITKVFEGKKELLRYTFLRDFEPVPGMAEVYRTWWRSSYDNVYFHFVSSSVFQLYEELEDFRRSSNFPPATFHLKTIRPKKILSSLQSIVADPRETKREPIESIIRRFPERKFVLIGDSGEKDPEVYASIARDYPAQIKAIFIRDVNSLTQPQRLQGVPESKYMFFTDAIELMHQEIFPFHLDS